MSRVSLYLLILLGSSGCMSWPKGASLPHREGAERARGDNPKAQATLHVEWRHELSVSAAFVKSRSYTSGVAIHDKLPIVALVGADRKLKVINRLSGQLLWEDQLEAAGVGRPFFIGDVIYAPTGDGRVIAYHIKRREVIWKRQFGGLIQSPITRGEGALYLTDGRLNVYALNPETGAVLWQHQHQLSRRVQSYQSGRNLFTLHGSARPHLHRGKLFVGYSDGRVRAFDAESGGELWVRDLAPQVDTFEDVDADFAVIGDTLYAASVATGLYALSLDRGSVRWFHPLEGIISLSAYEDSLILGLQYGALGRFDLMSRAFIWRVSAETNGTPQRPVRFPHGIAFTLSRGGLYVVNAHTGELRDQFFAGSGLQAPLAFSEDGWLYTTSLNGFLYALSPRGQ